MGTIVRVSAVAVHTMVDTMDIDKAFESTVMACMLISRSVGRVRLALPPFSGHEHTYGITVSIS